ncbi:MAG: RsmE family RNA methyltransferase [Candidatus Omnitrophota bacterium]
MYRFHSSPRNINSCEISIEDKNQLHHLRDVLRLKTNDKVVVFDDKGNEYNCLVKNLFNSKAVLEIKSRKTPSEEVKVALTVACAIPKKSKMDDIIDKLTQLGVTRIIPLSTQRVVVKLDKAKEHLKLSRWQKIAMASAKQSQRAKLPIIEPIKDIKEVLRRNKEIFDLKLIPTLVDSGRKSLKEVLGRTNPRSILVFIGPEGDFTPEEIDLAISSGCIPVSLGESVLRVETAAVAVASYIKLYEDS